MDAHVRMVGILNILFGAGSAVAGLLILFTVGSPFQIYPTVNALGVLIGFSAIFHMLAAIPCVAAGVYVRSFAPWARGLLICASALNLVNFPLGAAIGGYSLWVLLAEETDPLFSAPPQRRATPSLSRY